jgi:hypothetical protein
VAATTADDQPLRFPRGEACRLLVTIDADNPDGVTDITGMAIRCRIRDYLGVTLTALDKTVGSGITVVSALVFRVDYSSAQTLTLDPGYYTYDIFRTDSGSEAEWVPSSIIEVVRSVNYG